MSAEASDLDGGIDELRREEFPITRSGIYLDHATFGPPPARHVRAVTDFTARMSSHGLPDLLRLGEEGVEEVRARAAELLNCGPDSVCFVRSTSQGINLVAEGIDWRPGDEVVLYELDHPAGILPWLGQCRRGVRIRWIRDRGRQMFDADDVLRLLNPRTRALSLSLVNFAHGSRAAVEALAERCRQCDIWLAVDAAQAMGALHIDAPALGADVLVAHGYKFLLSGLGVGVCYCSDRAIRELNLTQVGWKSVRTAFDVDRVLDFRLEFAGGARRFESTLAPLPQLFGMGATIDLFLAAGLPGVERRVLSLASRLARGLAEKGYEVVGPQAQSVRSAILSVALTDPKQRSRIEDACARHQVACARRESRLRLSPHFYNTNDEVDRFLSAL